MTAERQYQSSIINELATALCKAQSMMEPIKATKKAKILTKKGGTIQYSYATVSDVLRALKEPLTSNGLSVSQRFESDANGNPILVTLLLHDSGQWISSYLTLHVTDTDFRVLGSAITYARRYSLTAITGLTILGEDDDAGAAAATAAPVPSALEGIDHDEPLADYKAEATYLKAVAVELYGEDQANAVLESLAAKRFRIADGDWRLIPRVKLDYAIEALRKKAAEKT